MAFKLERVLSAPNFECYELYPSTASETYTVGEVLTITSGKVTKAGADTDGTQKFICGADYVAPATGMKPIPVYRIHPDMIFRVTSQADNTLSVIGTSVEAHTDLLQVTATTTKGICEIVDLLGSGDVGTEVLVRFPVVAGR